MKLWLKIFIALGFGILTGLVFGERAAALQPLGSLFLKLINMIIVLLVLASMTTGIAGINDTRKLGRVGVKTLLLYASTTILSICIGFIFADYFQPGSSMELSKEIQIAVQETPSFSETFLSIVPINPVASMVSGNVMQIIVFACFLGFAINASGEQGKPLLHFFEALSTVMYRLTAIVMEFAPYGVFAIMAWVAGTFGFEALYPLGKLILSYYLACAVYGLLIFCGLLILIARLHPWPFFRGMRDAIMVAFSTGSSSAALPVTMHCAQENLGISKRVAHFVLPIGSTMNMNGTAIFQAMSCLFIAQAYGIQLETGSLLTIILTATLSSVGTAGVPGSGFIMLSAVLSSVGLPLEGLAILAGVDRLRDMIGTVLNIIGDAVVAVIVAKQEGELDESQYYCQYLHELEGSEV